MATKPKTKEKSNGSVRAYKADIVVTLKGFEPLYFNPQTDKLLGQLESGNNPGKDTREAKVQAEEKLIRNEQGQFMVPRRWVYACGRDAGKDVPYKSSRDKITSSTKGTKFPMLVRLHHEGYVLHDAEGNPMTEWRVTKEKGNNTNAGKGKGTAVCIIRPCIDPPWFIDVEMTVRTDRIDLEKIVQLWGVAGEQCGLGDGRPGCGKLNYGMFEVVRVEVLRAHKAPPRLVIEGLEKLQIAEEEESAAAASAGESESVTA